MLKHVFRKVWWALLLPAGPILLVLINNAWWAYFADLLTFAWLAVLATYAVNAVRSYVPKAVTAADKPAQADWR